MAIRGDVENTGNADLVGRVLVPIEHTIPAPARYTLFHQGHGEMLDHMLITRNLLAHYRGSEIHNEILHDESAAFAVDRKYPESDHAPVVATFDFLKRPTAASDQGPPGVGAAGRVVVAGTNHRRAWRRCARNITQTSDAIRPRRPGDREAPGSRGVRDRRQQPGGRRGRPRGRRVVAAAHKALLAAAARWLPEPERPAGLGNNETRFRSVRWVLDGITWKTPGSVADQLCRLLDDGPGIAARVGPWAYWVVRARAASRADRRVPRLHRDRGDRPSAPTASGIRAALPGVCGSRWTCETPWCIAGPVALMTLIDAIVGVDPDRRSLAKQR